LGAQLDRTGRRPDLIREHGANILPVRAKKESGTVLSKLAAQQHILEVIKPWKLPKGIYRRDPARRDLRACGRCEDEK
jgi:hypothetical protein